MNRYRFFSLIFSYPTKETKEIVADLSLQGGGLSQKAARILEDIEIGDLQSEYTRLFINAHPATLCPPYESFYREGLVYGKSSVAVRQIYESRGLNYALEGEPPDFIGAELDYLAITGDPEFLERFRQWVFAFTARVRENSRIYGPAAEELESFLSAGKDTRIP